MLFSTAHWLRFRCYSPIQSVREMIRARQKIKNIKQEFTMEIKNAFSFLVYPGKGLAEQPVVGGAKIPLSGKLFKMLSDLFAQADDECKIDICFTSQEEGKQFNERREQITAILNNPTIEKAQGLATHLQAVTTNRSGMGLLFLVLGENEKQKKIYISRFPADVGILAEQDKRVLRVEFLEKVFMRNAFAYKAVSYTDASLTSGFWKGKAIDKQINNNIMTISDYWIRDFLLSDFFTTPAQGTRRLAIALKDAAKSTNNLRIKEEIAASTRLVRNLNGKAISIGEFTKKFSFSKETCQTIYSKLKNPSLLTERFQFDNTEFEKNLPYRSIELDNGAVLTAATTDFDECFIRNPLEDQPGVYEFKTSGSVTNDRLRRNK